MLTEKEIKKGIEKEIYDSKDEDLLKYIRKNFEENDSLNKNDIEVLEKLENNTINLGLARMERIKEDNDLGWLKYVLPLILLIVAIIMTLISETIISNVDAGDDENLKQFESIALYIVNIGIIFLIYGFITFMINITGRRKKTTNYFGVLLKEIKENKINQDSKNVKEEDKKNEINQDSKNVKEEDKKNEISEINKKSKTVIIHTRYH